MRKSLPIYFPTHPYYQRHLTFLTHLTNIKIHLFLKIQPVILPRPDLALLGVSYRRIPILSIGRDVYLDTRLILQKLETLYPASAAHPGISSAHAAHARPRSAEHAALEQLISARVIDGDVFARGAQCLPAEAFADAAFLRDRAALMGVDTDKLGAAASPFSRDVLRRQRPEALVVMRRWVRWLEEGLLADGRDWILDSNGNTKGGPSLADIEAVWVLHWVAGVPGSLPPEVLSAEAVPRVHAWMQRFDDAVRAAASSRGKLTSLSGEDAARTITGSPFAEPEGEVLPRDPVVDAEGLRKGTPVRMWPTDYGSSHRDMGDLVSVDDAEFVIEAKSTSGSSVRIHAPRHGFKISKISGGSAASKM
jgi:hypothetical protein